MSVLDKENDMEEMDVKESRGVSSGKYEGWMEGWKKGRKDK